jgi:hypothetical protein
MNSNFSNWRAIFVAATASLLATVIVGTATSQTAITSQFDHFTTGFRLDGAHEFGECASCHIDGMFVGTPTNCVGCHTNAARVRATAKPPTHNVVTERCEACHRTTTWAPVIRVDHFEVLGSCYSCHNNQRAIGKPVNHIPAGNQCDACHNTRAFGL